MIHHRRFASGFRACEMDGPPTSSKEPETRDVGEVTCPACLAELGKRNLLPKEAS
jgi:hypothetical protein